VNYHLCLCNRVQVVGLSNVRAHPVKTPGQAASLVQEYARAGLSYPRAGHLLDLMRCTVVCSGPQQILDCLNRAKRGMNRGRATTPTTSSNSSSNRHNGFLCIGQVHNCFFPAWRSTYDCKQRQWWRQGQVCCVCNVACCIQDGWGDYNWRGAV
jgi:hypothetical protein